jgi:transcriptional regulator with XRE-family HTH domain
MQPAAEVTYPALLGRLLQHYREQQGMPQAQVAAMLGILQPSYSRIEKGDTAITVTQLRILARVFGLRPSQILNDADLWTDTLRMQGVTVTEEKEAPKAALLVGLAILAAGLLMASNTSKS